MAETRFIKTVTFGGYDKTEVDKRLEYLYNKIYELKNELRETKLTLEEYKKGTDAEKAAETILAGERAKLTQVQVQNETMSDRLKNAEEDNKTKDGEIKALQEMNKALTADIEEKRKKIEALEAGTSAEALSSVFIEAQKSASLLVATSRKEADELGNKSRQAADDMITDANNKAKKIIFEAEKEAAVISADAKNKSEQMDAASNNMKAVLLGEIESYMSRICLLSLSIRSSREARKRKKRNRRLTASLKSWRLWLLLSAAALPQSLRRKKSPQAAVLTLLLWRLRQRLLKADALFYQVNTYSQGV